MRTHLVLVLVFALAGLVMGGLVADRGPGLGIENVLGLLLGVAVGVVVALVLPTRNEH